MKKRCILIFLIQLLIMNLFGQSIGDFTLIHIPTGKTYNYYDDPNILFSIVGDKTVVQFEEKSKDYSNEIFDCYVFHHTVDVENWQPNYLQSFGVNDCINYYCCSDLTVYKDFKTSRDISIGDSYQKILNNYKNDIYYSNNSFNEIEALIKVKKISTENEKKIKANSCLFIKQAFFKYNRYPEINFPLTYYLVFELDNNKNVKSIRFTYVFDAI